MKKILVLFLLILPFFMNAQAQKSHTALLIIDVQYFYFPGGAVELVNPIPASLKAGELLADFRKHNDLVIHIKHASSSGSEIHENVKPLPTEKVIVKTKANSFVGTELLNCLRENQIDTLVICGMQTHMCVEAAVRAATDYGFTCIVPQDACATRDLKFRDKLVKAEDVHTSTLATFKSYAKVIDTEEWLNSRK